MINRYHINVRQRPDGPIISVIDGINPLCSAYALACKLINAGEYDLTVLTTSNGKAGQVLTGRWGRGYYCCEGKSPEHI